MAFAKSGLRPASLVGKRLEKYVHTCAFVRGEEEELRVTAPFLAEGLEWGEKAFYIVDPARKAKHLSKLQGAGVDTSAYADRIEMRDWHETYLKDGHFDPDRMLTTLDDVMRQGLAQGNPRLRIVGQMGWALERHPGVEYLIEYECRANEVLNRWRQPAVCIYDLDRMSASMMMDVMRTHPVTVVSGTLYENPYYTPPEQMLEELRARKLVKR
ncbi:MAG: MEDS domain-containing protein [Planctomycetota bacterium]